MEELLVHVLVRLVTINENLGDEAFEKAVGRALLAIGQVALEEAEATSSVPRTTAMVIPFPERPPPA